MNENNIEFSCLQAIAGEASLSGQQVLEALEITKASIDDLADPEARKIWAALESLIREGKPIDAVVLASKVPTVDGRKVRSVVLQADIGTLHGRLTVLHEAATRRRYLEALRGLAGAIKNKSASLTDIISEAQKSIGAWQDDSRGVEMADSSVFAFIDEVEKIQNGERAPILKTGIEAWDAAIGGLQSTLTVVGAMPGVGKSAFVAGVVRNLCSQGVRVGLLSLEDERSWIVRRLIAHESRVPAFFLGTKRLDSGQLERFAAGAETVHGWLRNLAIDDRSGLNVREVVASARRMISTEGVKVVFVDHLGEIAVSRTERHDLDVADVLRELRTIAKVTRVPVVVLTHLRRREGLGVDGQPKATDFANSSGVERMARVAVGLWKDGDTGDLNCSVLKQTNGAAGVTFTLRMNRSAGIVIDSPATEEARKMYGA